MAEGCAHAGRTADSEGVAGGVHVRTRVCDPGEKPAALRDAGAVFCGRGVRYDVGVCRQVLWGGGAADGFGYSLFMTRSIYCKRNRIIPLVVDSMSNK